MTTRIEELELHQITTSTLNARQSFDKVKMAELAASIEEKGVLEPIIVRPRKEKDRFEVICGTRRLLASKTVDLKSIPVRVHLLNDQEAREIAAIENLQREDLNAMDEADGYRVALKYGQHDPNVLADRVGKPIAHIRARMALLKLETSTQELIRSGELTAGHGLLLLRIGPSERKNAVKRIKEERLSVRAMEKSLGSYQYNHMKLSDGRFSKEDCKTCQFCGSGQQDMFEKSGLKGLCTDPDCFKKKWVEAYKVRLAALEKSGVSIVIDVKADNYKNRKTVDLGDQHDSNQYRRILKKKFASKCLKCKDLLYVAGMEEYGETTGLPYFRLRCGKPSCCATMTGQSELADAAGKTSSSYNKESRVRTSRRLAWTGALTQGMTPRVMLAIMLNDAEMAPENVSYNKANPRSYYLYGVAKLEKEMTRVAKDNIGGLSDEDMEFLAEAIGYKIKSDFVINEEYLQDRRKDHICEIAKEVGLDKFLLAEKKISKKKNLASYKKSELLDFFLKSGFKLAGKVPKEVAGKKVKGKK